jgi:hypothetical protein
MAVSQFPVTAAPPSTIPGRVAELEAMVERLLAVQERTVAALDQLTPAPAIAAQSGGRPVLRVLRGGGR